jgi:hypothetical protein
VRTKAKSGISSAGSPFSRHMLPNYSKPLTTEGTVTGSFSVSHLHGSKSEVKRTCNS